VSKFSPSINFGQHYNNYITGSQGIKGSNEAQATMAMQAELAAKADFFTEASVLNKSSPLAAALGVTKFVNIISLHLVTLCWAALDRL
jgi:hypothetical protein